MKSFCLSRSRGDFELDSDISRTFASQDASVVVPATTAQFDSERFIALRTDFEVNKKCSKHRSAPNFYKLPDGFDISPPSAGRRPKSLRQRGTINAFFGPSVA
jgi:hypothetical protein